MEAGGNVIREESEFSSRRDTGGYSQIVVQKEIDVARGECRRREEVRLKEGRDTKEGIQVVSSLVIGSSGDWRKIVVYVHDQLWFYILYE